MIRIEVNDGYAALYVAIVDCCTPELAFKKIWNENTRYRSDITNEDIEDMFTFKNRYKMTYRQIGRIYCMSLGAVYRKMRRYQASTLEKEARYAS